jgi:hypothetical protein
METFTHGLISISHFLENEKHTWTDQETSIDEVENPQKNT